MKKVILLFIVFIFSSFVQVKSEPICFLKKYEFYGYISVVKSTNRSTSYIVIESISDSRNYQFNIPKDDFIRFRYKCNDRLTTGGASCQLEYKKINDTTYHYVGSGYEPSSGCTGDEINFNAYSEGDLIILRPQSPKINRENGVNENVYNDGTDNYTLCSCDCNTIITTSYGLDDIEYDWFIYLGNNIDGIPLVSSINRKRELIVNFKELFLNKNIAENQVVTVVFKPRHKVYKTWDFPRSKPMSINVVSQSKFTQLKSGKNVDVYPCFGSKGQQEGWVAAFQMPNCKSNDIHKDPLKNEPIDFKHFGITPQNTIDKNVFGEYFLQKVMIPNESVPNLPLICYLKAQVSSGDATFSNKSCYAYESISLPSLEKLKLDVVPSENVKVDNEKNIVYLCGDQSSFLVESSRGVRLSVLKEGNTINKDIRYGYGECSIQVSVDSESKLGEYTLEFVDFAGSPHVKKINVIRASYPNVRLEDINSQTCSNNPNGSVKALISNDGWVFNNTPIFPESTVQTESHGLMYSKMRGGMYTFSFSGLTHKPSGCTCIPIEKKIPFKIESKIISTDFSIEGGNVQCLNCVSGSKNIKLLHKTEDKLFSDSLRVYVNGSNIDVSNIMLGKSLVDSPHKIKVAYSEKSSCSDYSEKELVLKDPIVLNIDDCQVNYNAYKLQLSVSNFLEYKYELVKINDNKRVVVASIPSVNSSSILSDVEPGKYEVVFSKNSCSEESSVKREIVVYGKVAINPDSYIPVKSCLAQPILPNVQNGSGEYELLYKGLKENKFRPFSGNFNVGTYVIKALDKKTGLYSDERTVVVGATERVDISAPKTVSAQCFNYPIDVPVEVTGGSNGYTFKINDILVSSLQDNKKVHVESGLYNNFIDNKAKITVTDGIGCTSTTVKDIEFLNPLQVKATIDALNSSFETQCQTPAKVRMNVENAVGDLTYCYTTISNNVQNTTRTKSNPIELKETGNAIFHVVDGNGCLSNSITQEITSSNVNLVVQKTTESRLKRIGDKNAKINLSANLGASPYQYACISYGVDPKLSDWSSPALSYSCERGAGTYSLFVKDENGCTDKKTITIINPFDGLNFCPHVFNLNCNQSNDGKIVIDVEKEDNMSLRELVVKNVLTGVEQTKKINSTSTYVFDALQSGTYSLFVRNDVGFESDAKLVTISESRDVDIIVNPIEPLFDGDKNKNIATNVIFKIVDNKNTISKVEYKNNFKEWVELFKDNINLNYSFAADKGGVYDIKITKCNEGNFTIKHVDVLQIPKPNISFKLLQPVNNESKGKIVFHNNVVENDTRYFYKCSLVKENEAKQINLDILPSEVSKELDNIDIGKYTLTIRSFYNNEENGTVKPEVKGDVTPASIEIYNALKVALKDSKVNVRICNGAKAGEKLLTEFLNRNVEVYGGKDDNGKYSFSFISASTSQEYVLDNSISLASDKYFVKVKDSFGTEVVTAVPFDVKELEPLDLRFNGEFMLPCFESIGEFKITPTGGCGSYGSLKIVSEQDGKDITSTIDLTNGDYVAKLGRGSYRFTTSDILGCYSPEYSKTVSAPELLTLEIDEAKSLTDLKCKNTNEGKVVLDAKGGNNKPYVYSYLQGNSSVILGSNVADNLAIGEYTFVVQDSKKCSASIARKVRTDFIPQNVDFKIDSSRVKCFGEKNGSIRIENGSKSFGYKLHEKYSKSELDFTGGLNSNLGSGIYTVTCVNPLNQECNQTFDVGVSQPEPLLVVGLHVVPTCKGDRNGSISFKATGGNGGWYATINKSNKSFADKNGLVSFTGLASTPECSISLIDSKGCVSENDTKTNVGNLSTLNDLDVDIHHACEAHNSASISLTPKDSLRTQSWKFYQEVGGRFLSQDLNRDYHKLIARELTPGVYKSVYTDDETKCEIVNRVDEIHPKVEIVSVVAKKVKCKGDKALVKVDIGKTSDPVKYFYKKQGEVSEVEFNPDSDPLSVGDYSLIVRSKYCEASAPFVIVEPERSLDFTISPFVIKTIKGVDFHVACNGGSNGRIAVTPVGGWGDYTLTIDEHLVNGYAEIANLKQGEHDIKLTDKEGCIVDKKVTLNAPSFSFTLDEVKKSQEKVGDNIANAVVVKPSGGFGAYSIKLDAFGTVKSAPNEGDQVEFNFSGAGVFRFTATDDLGCEDILDVHLDKLSQLKYSKEAFNPTCFGGNDGSVSITGGVDAYSYTLTGESSDVSLKGNGIIKGLKKGNYNLKVSDGVFTEFSTVDIVDPLPVSISSSIDPTCHFVDNGVVRVKLNNATSINRYSVKLTDGSSKFTTQEIQGEEEAKFVGLANGSFKIEVANVNSSCAGSDKDESTIEVDRLNALKPSISSVHFCDKERGKVVGDFNVGSHLFTADLLQKSDADNEWKVLSSTKIGGSVNNLAPEVVPGRYRFRTTDQKYGCEEYSESVIVYPSPLISKVNVDNEVCFGQKGTLKVFAESGSGKLSIFQGQTDYERIFNNSVQLAPGSYKLLVYDDLSGCSVNYPKKVFIDGPAEPLKFKFDPVSYGDYNIDCNGNSTGKILVNISGGGSLKSASFKDQTFTTRDFSLTNLPAGWKSFEAIDSFGCLVKDSVELRQPSPLTLAIAESKLNLGCSKANEGKVYLQAAGGALGYLFSKNQEAFLSNGNFENLAVGSYNFRVKDGNGCVSELNTSVDTKFIPYDLHLNTRNVSCFGVNDGKIEAVSDGTNHYSYKWHSDGSTEPQISNLSPGLYGVTVSTANGCSKDLFTQITQPEKLSFSLTSKSACPGEVNGIVNFDAVGGTMPYTFLLNDKPFGSIGKGISAAYGLYVAKVVDANGCSEMQSLTIEKKEGSISANFLVATTSATSDTLALVDICNPMPDYIKWDLSNEGHPIHRVNEESEAVPLVKFEKEGEYRVTMTAHYGECEYVVSKIISVKNGVISDGSKSFVFGSNGIKDFEIYPNPTQGQSRFKITLYQPNETILQVFDLKGNLINMQEIPRNGGSEGIVDFKTRIPGVYIVRVMLKNKKDYREVKVVVQ